MTRQQILASGLVMFGLAGLLATVFAPGTQSHAAPAYTMTMHVGTPVHPDPSIRTKRGALDCRRVFSLVNVTIGHDCRRVPTTVALGN